MDPKEIGINMMNWVDSAQDKDYWKAFLKAALNLQVLHAKKRKLFVMESFESI